jgi:hypothetical protein
LQRDPNATGAPVLTKMAFHGMSLHVPPLELDLQRHYTDGLSTFQYLRSNPAANSDPSGLVLGLGNLLANLQGFAERLWYDARTVQAGRLAWELADDAVMAYSGVPGASTFMAQGLIGGGSLLGMRYGDELLETWGDAISPGSFRRVRDLMHSRFQSFRGRGLDEVSHYLDDLEAQSWVRTAHASDTVGGFRWSLPTTPGVQLRYHPGGSRFDAEHFSGAAYWVYSDGTHSVKMIAR